MALIEVENLRKTFKREIRKPGLTNAVKSIFHREYESKMAVEDISFRIEKGEILGYIGPNGAGKSTTIKMMVGILTPTSGKVTVKGVIPYENRIENSKRIGVVFGQRSQLWWDIPLCESFNLLKYIYKIPEKQYRENLARFAEVLDINSFINVPVRQLSLGQKMRGDLCAALLHNPEILFLDEPTIGLDVVVKENIRQFIREINQNFETTVILTTHDISDIEKLCSRVMVIDQGKKMYDGNLTHLKNNFGTGEELVIETDSIVSRVDSLRDMDIADITCEKNKILVRYSTDFINATQIIEKVMSEYKIKDFKLKETEIEEIIRRIYKREVTQEVAKEVR